ncbi:AEC family transporter [Thalassococcus sp. BH17M4-6]|uniref:AEC family transporter n=1 Tax=Thalassococcus sp. BH17M4-6 TaxID=3413148 RepID=UPI003BC69440
MLTSIWPIFALIWLGFGLARWRIPSAEFWPAAERLNYFVLFPALLVSSLADAPVRDPEVLRLGGAAVSAIMIAAIALGLFRRIRPMSSHRYGPVVQGVIRFNTYLALSLIATLSGSDGLEKAAFYLALAVPLVNLLSILALSDAGAAKAPSALMRSILTNPLILACLAGLALAITRIGLPFGADRLVALLGQGSLPLGLLCVGAALRPGSLRGDALALMGTSAARLLLMPLLGVAIAHLFGLEGPEAIIMVVFCAVPTAPTAYVLTQQMKGDGQLMAGLVTFQTMAAAVSIPMMLTFLVI